MGVNTSSNLLSEAVQESAQRRLHDALAAAGDDFDFAGSLSSVSIDHRRQLGDLQLLWLLDTPPNEILSGFESTGHLGLLQAKLWELFLVVRAKRLKTDSEDSGGTSPSASRQHAGRLCDEAVQTQQECGLGKWTVEDRAQLLKRSGQSFDLATSHDHEEVARRVRYAVCLLASENASTLEASAECASSLRQSTVPLPWTDQQLQNLPEQRLVAMIRTNGEVSLACAKAMHQLAKRFLTKSKPQMAQPLLHQSLEAHSQLLGGCHPDTLDVASSLAKVFAASKEPAAKYTQLLSSLLSAGSPPSAEPVAGPQDKTAVTNQTSTLAPAPGTLLPSSEVRVEYTGSSRGVHNSPNRSSQHKQPSAAASDEPSAAGRLASATGRAERLQSAQARGGSPALQQRPDSSHQGSKLREGKVLPVLAPLRGAPKVDSSSDLTLSGTRSLPGSRRSSISSDPGGASTLALKAQLEQMEVLACSLAEELQKADQELRATKRLLASAELKAQ